MKHNTPTQMHRNLSTTLPLRRDTEFAVNARLLYPFISNPVLSFDQWIESQFQMTSSRQFSTNCRLMTGDNGDLFLNEDLATLNAQLAARDVVGAIAWVLIVEGVKAASAGDPDFTNQKLSSYTGFTSAGGLIAAVSLYRFLEVSKGFDDWLCDLKQRHVMRYGVDYVRVYTNARGMAAKCRRDNGEGHVIFGHRFAYKVAVGEPTHIGSLMRFCMQNFCRGL